MNVDITNFISSESGPAVLLGNGLSLNPYQGAKFSCPIIGINRSVDYFPEQDYFVTVSFDRLRDIAEGRITARRAVFSCEHKKFSVPEDIKQSIVWVYMPLDDDYGVEAYHTNVFTIDLTKPVRKTFGGLFAIQVAWFLGFNPLYLVGFDGGDEKFFGFNPRAGEATPGYHNLCMWHVADWMKSHVGYRIYNCSKESKIERFPYAPAPVL